MKKFIIAALSAVLLSVSVFAQQQQTSTQQPAAPQQQEVVVRIKQDAPATATPPPERTVAQKANEWVEFGKNVGTAMDAGLTSLTDHADKFSKTDAGKFTMAVIAWKVAGRDASELTQIFVRRAIGLIVGIPLQIIILYAWYWVMTRYFLPRKIVTKKTGAFWEKGRVVEYKVVNNASANSRYEGTEGSITNDERHVGLFLSTAAAFIFTWANIALVIL